MTHPKCRGNKKEKALPKPKAEYIDAGDRASVANAVMLGVCEDLQKSEDAVFITNYLEQDPIVGHVSTGCFLLDCAIGFPTCLGIPMPSIVEIVGTEQTAKSLLTYKIMANIQAMGGWASLCDVEGTFTHEYGYISGLKMGPEAFGYSQINRLEEVMVAQQRIVQRHVAMAPDMPLALGVDSVAATTTEAEQETKSGKDPARALHARILARALRSGLMTSMFTKVPVKGGGHELLGRPIVAIFVNQLKSTMNPNPYGQQFDSFGGKALKYHARVRIELTRGAEIVDEKTKVPLGFRVRARVLKSKVAPKHPDVEINFRYDHGLEDFFPVMDFMEANDGIEKSGNFYVWKGRKYYPNAFREMLTTNPQEWNELTSACLKVIGQVWGGHFPTPEEEVIIQESKSGLQLVEDESS